MSPEQAEPRERLRAAFGRAIESLPPDVLAHVLESAAAAGDCGRARLHLATCPTCREDFTSRPAGHRASRRAWLRAPPPVRIAALLALAALVLIAVETHVGSRMTAQATAQTVRFGLQTPAGATAAVPRRFEWEPVHGAARYGIRLLEMDGALVWGGESAGSGIDVASVPDLASALAPGHSYLWEVTALDAAGRVIGAGGPASFAVTLQRIAPR